jgi:uncharacterized membrane protein
MRDDRVKRMALGGMLASMVLLATWLLKIPGVIGYIHLGDGVIFLSAMLMGSYAALIAGVGSALADWLSGYQQYILATFMIKAAMGFLVATLAKPGKQIRNLFVFTAAELVMIAGYFLFEAIFIVNWKGALANIPLNLLQGAAGVALGMAFSVYLPHLKKKL